MRVFSYKILDEDRRQQLITGIAGITDIEGITGIAGITDVTLQVNDYGFVFNHGNLSQLTEWLNATMSSCEISTMSKNNQKVNIETLETIIRPPFDIFACPLNKTSGGQMLINCTTVDTSDNCTCITQRPAMGDDVIIVILQIDEVTPLHDSSINATACLSKLATCVGTENSCYASDSSSSLGVIESSETATLTTATLADSELTTATLALRELTTAILSTNLLTTAPLTTATLPTSPLTTATLSTSLLTTATLISDTQSTDTLLYDPLTAAILTTETPTAARIPSDTLTVATLPSDAWTTDIVDTISSEMLTASMPTTDTKASANVTSATLTSSEVTITTVLSHFPISEMSTPDKNIHSSNIIPTPLESMSDLIHDSESSFSSLSSDNILSLSTSYFTDGYFTASNITYSNFDISMDATFSLEVQSTPHGDSVSESKTQFNNLFSLVTYSANTALDVASVLSRYVNQTIGWSKETELKQTEHVNNNKTVPGYLPSDSIVPSYYNGVITTLMSTSTSQIGPDDTSRITYDFRHSVTSTKVYVTSSTTPTSSSPAEMASDNVTLFRHITPTLASSILFIDPTEVTAPSDSTNVVFADNAAKLATDDTPTIIGAVVGVAGAILLVSLACMYIRHKKKTQGAIRSQRYNTNAYKNWMRIQNEAGNTRETTFIKDSRSQVSTNLPAMKSETNKNMAEIFCRDSISFDRENEDYSSFITTDHQIKTSSPGKTSNQNVNPSQDKIFTKEDKEFANMLNTDVLIMGLNNNIQYKNMNGRASKAVPMDQSQPDSRRSCLNRENDPKHKIINADEIKRTAEFLRDRSRSSMYSFMASHDNVQQPINGKLRQSHVYTTIDDVNAANRFYYNSFYDGVSPSEGSAYNDKTDKEEHEIDILKLYHGDLNTVSGIPDTLSELPVVPSKSNSHIYEDINVANTGGALSDNEHFNSYSSQGEDYVQPVNTNLKRSLPQKVSNVKPSPKEIDSQNLTNNFGGEFNAGLSNSNNRVTHDVHPDRLSDVELLMNDSNKGDSCFHKTDNDVYFILEKLDD
ncbi:hypothetical protein Btru_055697 [Bulinus truncatus]|nr:hypothetical protein Btru_055697 [Bulinus truncatus]